MSTLSPNDSAWVNAQLATYPIPYVEIYNEITDHIISAIEAARIAGDGRDIDTVFFEVMATHFPGEKTIEKIVLKYVLAFNRKISKMMWDNFVYYLTWPVIVLISIMITAGFYLPLNKFTSGVFMGLLLVLAAIPQWYAFFKMPSIGKIKVNPSKSFSEPGNRQKQSLTRGFVKSRSGRLMLVCIANLTFIGFFAKKYHINFLNPLHYYPVFYMVLVAAFAIYGLGCMRLCRQEFKITD